MVTDGESIVPVRVRIQQLLDAAHKNPAWLAEKAGVPRSTISRVLRGDRIPTAETLQCVAPVLGVTLAELVHGTEVVDRVKDAQELVHRRDYEAAVQKMIEYERKANDLEVRLRYQEEQSRKDLGNALSERDQARRDALRNEVEARRYRQGFDRAIADVEKLREQVRELGATARNGVWTSRAAAIMASIAAAWSVANYFKNDTDGDDGTDSETETKKNEGNES